MASSKKVVRRVKASTSDSDKIERKMKAVEAVKADRLAREAEVAEKKAHADEDRLDRMTGRAKAKAGKKPFILFRPFIALGHYISDSWNELKQVHWPNRRETWQMTLGVIIFCTFIGVIVLISDWASQWIIEEVIL